MSQPQPADTPPLELEPETSNPPTLSSSTRENPAPSNKTDTSNQSDQPNSDNSISTIPAAHKSNSPNTDHSDADSHRLVSQKAAPSGTTGKTLSTETSTNQPSASASKIIASLLKTASKTPRRLVDTVQFVVGTEDSNSERNILKRQTASNYKSQLENQKEANFDYHEKRSSFLSPETPMSNENSSGLHDLSDIFRIIDQQKKEMRTLEDDKHLYELNHEDDNGDDWVVLGEDFEADPLEFLLQFQALTNDEEKFKYLVRFHSSFKNHLKKFNSMSLEKKDKLMDYHRQVLPEILSLLTEQDWNQRSTHLLLRIAIEILDTDVKGIGSANLLHFWSFLQILGKRLAIVKSESMHREEAASNNRTPKKGRKRSSSNSSTSSNNSSTGKNNRFSDRTGQKPKPLYISPIFIKLLLNLTKRFRRVLIHAETEHMDLKFKGSTLHNMIHSVIFSLVEHLDAFVPELKYYMVRYRDCFTLEEVIQLLNLYETHPSLGSWMIMFVLYNNDTAAAFEEYFKLYIVSRGSLKLRELEFVACYSTHNPESVAENHEQIFDMVMELEEHTQHSRWLAFLLCITEHLCVNDFAVLAFEYLERIWKVHMHWNIPLSAHDVQLSLGLYRNSGMVGRSLLDAPLETDQQKVYTIIDSLIREFDSCTREHKKLEALCEALLNIIQIGEEGKGRKEEEIHAYIVIHLRELKTFDEKRYMNYPHAGVRKGIRALLKM